MLIGDRKDESKLYRGIRHYDGLPLTSEDIHEESNLVARKTALLTNNLVGNGTLNEPTCTITNSGISLDEPAVVMIDGDVSLIQSDEGFPIAYLNDIRSAGYEDGVVCILGWYQHLDQSSTIKSYGGVRNYTITNDLLDSNVGGVQVSTRYQFRWDIVLVSYEDLSSGESFKINYLERDSHGAVTTMTAEIEVPDTKDRVKIIQKLPLSMLFYAESDLYLVPILRYKFSNGELISAESYRAIKPVPHIEVLKSSTTPEGEFREGTHWYNPDTGTYQVYISDRFASTTNPLSLNQYTNTVTLEEDVTTPSDIELSIDILQYSTGDILRVIYEGVELVEGENYSLDSVNGKITLSSFTTKAGDRVTFIVNKLISL